jgi:alkanesulfonate monooxygenase SsuD/methylene tetrahydromethanopterin reductase-like flavin-dependent oxidoreductase (luciferase family)
MPSDRNAVEGERSFWGVLPVIRGSEILDAAKLMEDAGFDGVFAEQIYGPPFLPLAAAAAATTRLKIGTGIAIAAARSPFETATAALDLDRISDGRFVLGLGSSLSSCTVNLFGAPDYKLLTHLRDTVAAVRHIIAGAHTGLEPYHGVYFQADFKEMIPAAAPVRVVIPIWIAALRNKMTDVALEIGDGVMVHALWSATYTSQVMAPFIRESLAKHGRQRSEIEINAWPWVAINDDRQQAIDDSRATLAAYAGIRPYEPFFEAQGFGEQARLCQEAWEHHSDVVSVVQHVPDEMVTAFIACGSIEQVQQELEPFWEVVDSLCPMTPYRELSPEKLHLYSSAVNRLVAAAKA